MFSKIQKSKLVKAIAIFLAFSMFTQIFNPQMALALTGGPSQPEVHGFTPIGTTDMVNPFTGDFSYNIPLLDVGGYPINLSYSAGIGMDQEASWVGLGWSVNPGVINRNVRGIPDDFNGDEITSTTNVKNNFTFGINFTPSMELLGFKAADQATSNLTLSCSYNNYSSFALNVGYDPTIASFPLFKDNLTGDLGVSLSAGSDGVGIEPKVSFTSMVKDTKGNDVQIKNGIGLGYNSRAGLSELSLSSSSATGTIVENKKGEKEFEEKFSNNGGSSISFATKTYTPQISSPTTNVSFSFRAKLGGEGFGAYASSYVGGFFSGAYYKKSFKSRTSKAYGYMYSQEATDDEALMDFNREKDGPFMENTPFIAVTNHTYDILSVSGQGIGGMYRPFRNDVGIVHDPTVRSHSGGLNFPALELGGGNLIRLGGNISMNYSTSTSGEWKEEDDKLKSSFEFTDYNVYDPEYEPYYFKQAGEKTAECDEDFITAIGGYHPVRAVVDNTHMATKRFKNNKDDAVTFSRSKRQTRQPRNEGIITLNSTEASQVGLIKTLDDYTENNFTLDPSTNRYLNYSDNARNTTNYAHHISEITAYRSDGARYVYGIPAYNNTKEEVTFAISQGNPDQTNGLVSYEYGVDDNPDKNKNGLDHYYQKTVTPGYAHSYLLTAILSADYVDVDNNGPTDNDLGTYTRINYSKVNDNYEWRVPVAESKANYNEGLKNKAHNDVDSDDKASYIYGKKELWYIHSIETKTHIAEFHISDRKDGHGVESDKGKRDNAMDVMQLDKIVLYSRYDKIQEVNGGVAAVPIKTVHFTYDNSLCPEVPNSINYTETGLDLTNPASESGKLTLKEVYFTYGNSDRGKLGKYTFEYGQIKDTDGITRTVNPPYNLKGYDRWGNFSPNPVYDDDSDDDKDLYAWEFPYVNQEKVSSGVLYNNIFQEVTSGGYDFTNSDDPDRTMADVFAHAWNLTKITLPTKGTITVEYEADDYAYVQNKKAMQMFKVKGMAETASGSEGSSIYSTSSTPIIDNNFIVIDLPKSYPTGSDKEDFAEDFLKDDNGNLIEYMYFRFLVNLENSTYVSRNAYEFIQGYAQIKDYGFRGTAPYTEAYIELEPTEINDGISWGIDVNPIAQASWNFIRLNLPTLATRASTLNDKIATLAMAKSLLATAKSIVQFIAGYNKTLRKEGYAKKFMPEKSWIRLYNPDGFKQGGGHRVKKLIMSDEWQGLTSNHSSNYTSAEYGQEYEYTTEINGVTLSSGVAAYEPVLGGEENPLRQPIFYDEDRKLVPDNRFYQETPLGESFYPGASVGYSKVTVKNLQNTNITAHATGKVVHQFYTAKDFPVITNITSLTPAKTQSNPVLNLLKIYSFDYITASQGYSIILNDMHGKQKSQEVYAEGMDAPMSGVRYYYHLKATRDGSAELYSESYTNEAANYKYLDNSVLVMYPDGEITTKEVGVDYDMVMDMREQHSEFHGGGIGANVDGFLATILPLVIPTIIPSYFQEDIRFRSIATTKVINKYGLIKEVEAFDNQSSIKTKNLMLDAITGEVLLTETQNAFDDPVYTFKYPAHFAYEGMGPAYKNLGLQSNTVNMAELHNYLIPGDEILYEGERCWVSSVDENEIYAYYEDGYYRSIYYSGSPTPIKIIRSGRRNMQNTPIGQVVSLINPLQDNDGDGYYDALSFDKVLNASASRFTESANIYCDCDYDYDNEQPHNPYTRGSKGNWKPYISYLYLTDRTQSNANFNTNLRDDGVFGDFKPFWRFKNGEEYWFYNDNKWTYTSEVTIFSPHGEELENKDALGRYSSAVYGYNNKLPVSVGANAKYAEIGFDGFEDYSFDNCTEYHFSFRTDIDPSTDISSSQSHSGKHSAKVSKGSSIKISKNLNDCGL